MVCDICQKIQATVHLTEIINEKVVEMHICSDCAQDKANELKEQLSVSNLLGGLIEGKPVAREKNICCNVCGLTYREFKKKGRLGCGNCYIVFREQLNILLKNVHGSTNYMGKQPPRLDGKINREKQLKELRYKLARSIELEHYEEAAGLRDDIKKIEESNV